MDSRFTENMSYYNTQNQPWPGQQQMAAYPPQPQSHPTPQFPRTLDVTFTSWTGRHLRICEGTEDGPLVYAADLKNRKPHMLFQATGTARLPATVVFHNFSRTIDITINGDEMPMRTASVRKNQYAFDCPALGGRNLVWKRMKGWKALDLECVDETGTVYAVFRSNESWSMKKAGKLEILQPCAAGGPRVCDEIVVTGMATLQLHLMQLAAAGAASGSAGASAAVSV
ncbi:uncharacterized protein BJX67DRAFT_366183 [Aspergillus lucknowensis]|uniref:Uncharacterized protein n=1 Tax=Aspergillus lucknowensis TaxID=176173 RepID=A0ABR4LDA9_9EURO